MQVDMQRRAVKQFAIDCEKEIKKYKGMSYGELSAGGLEASHDKLVARMEELKCLRAEGLSTERPVATVARSLKSGMLIAAAAVTRATAAAGGGAAGLVHAAGLGLAYPVIGAVRSPMKGAMDMLAGVRMGAHFGAQAGTVPAIALVPVGMVGGGALMGALGAMEPVSNIPGNLLTIPRSVLSRGSPARKTYRLIDQYRKAKAHVARKSMSPAEIIASLDTSLCNTLNGQLQRHARGAPSNESPLIFSCGSM